MVESDPLSEYNKIPRDHIVVSMAPFTLKSSSKLRSALHFRYSKIILITIITVVFVILLTTI